MVNINGLKSALQERNITINQASEAIGINPATFFRRISKHGVKFTVEEIDKLAELLNLDGPTIQSIFFDK